MVAHAVRTFGFKDETADDGARAIARRVFFARLFMIASDRVVRLTLASQWPALENLWLRRDAS